MSKKEDATDAFIEVYRPGGQQELIFIKSTLDAAGIVYYVDNENLNRLFYSLGPIGAGEMRLMVEQSQAQEAVAILRHVLQIHPLDEE